jgi:hypothetical protein
VPTYAHALPWLPSRRDIFADGVDHAEHFMPRHARVGDARKVSFFRDQIAVTDAARLNLDSNSARARLGDRTFDQFQWTPFA